MPNTEIHADHHGQKNTTKTHLLAAAMVEQTSSGGSLYPVHLYEPKLDGTQKSAEQHQDIANEVQGEASDPFNSALKWALRWKVTNNKFMAPSLQIVKKG